MTNRNGPTSAGHEPVLLGEACELLITHRDGRYLDGTFGGGGHTAAILVQTAPNGTVLAIDVDPVAEHRAILISKQSGVLDRLTFVHANFENLATVARSTGFAPIDGVLLDLGLSSFQLDDPDRGFSFRFDGPIDMRFDPTRGSPASDLVNNLPADELANLIWRYGEEPRSRRIASAIERERQRAPIETAAQLATVIERAVGGRRGSDTHPATRTFQAMRIAVNDELGALQRALTGAVDVLTPGGRLVVISFHSLEDRIVKQYIQRESATCICPPEQPICTCDHQPRLRALTRGVKPAPDEVARNPRSRSAILRAAERMTDGGRPVEAR